MARNLPEPDPRSELEDQGVPDLQDGTPEQRWAEDPQSMAVPGDEPLALDDHGTTASEQREGEPLRDRLDREEPDPAMETGALDERREAGRIVEDDEGARTDTEKDAVAYDAGPDAGGYTAEERAMRIEDE
ncbi:DUF5709 domain-containing protein [Spirillospora sp. CA-294931]|uniref:DUF5709 domain-containing protein n=1 Tax=Spirillospora sp. CA-294931 TaxID=3240042 RepID=UPI003D90BA61